MNMNMNEETTSEKETNVKSDITMGVKMKITMYDENKSAEPGNQN